MQDVALLAVGVMQERQTRRAVRVIFNCRNLRRNAFLLTAEIDCAVLLLVTAAAMPDGDLTMRVASARALLRLDERFFRRLLGDFALIEHGHEAPRCCIWIKAFQCHNVLFSSGTPRGFPLKFPIFGTSAEIPGLSPGLKIVRVLDHFFAGRQFYVSLFPVAAMPFGAAAAAKFAVKNSRAHSGDLHFKNLLNRFLDLRLGRGHGHFKHDCMLRLLHPETFLGDDGPANHVIGVDIHRSSLAYFLPLSFFAAGFFAEAFFAGAAFFLAAGFAGLAALGVAADCAGSIVTISGGGAPVRGPSVVARRTAASFDSTR